MSNESRAKDWISFQEVAKLAATPKPASESDTKDNSGMIDFAALAASEAQATRGKPGDFAKLPPPVAPPPVSSRRTVEKQSPAPAVPPPAPTSPLPFGTDAPAGRQPSSVAAISPMASSFGATSHTLPGVGQRSKIVPPTPALPAVRPPPPQAPRVAASPSARTPSIAAPPPAMAPPSTLSPATFSPQTGRPTAMAAGSQGTGGAGAVWLALGVGMGLGALLATVFFQTRAVDASHAAAAQAAERPQVVKTDLPSAPTAGGGGPSLSSGKEGPNSQASPGAVAAQGDTNAVPPAEESPPAGQALAKHNEPALPGRGVSPPSSTVSPAGGAGGAGGQAPAAAKASTAISDQSLEALMKKAVGIGAQPAATPPMVQPAVTAPAAAIPAGDVPIKPAMGAVQGAVGTVLPATRYCLGPDDAVSHATITFKSDGSAQNVAVSGPAAGQPAEACIRSRLMTARVPPFSSPTFTWTVTVRPAS